MTADRIDFISSYCDRWCERCSYTARCSAFACQVAVAMCGDAAEGLVEDDPVQNDWNGSAKVALISVERAEIAWQTIAAASSDPLAKILADQLAVVRGLLPEAFSQATSFVRPGFDEPWRYACTLHRGRLAPQAGLEPAFAKASARRPATLRLTA